MLRPTYQIQAMTAWLDAETHESYHRHEAHSCWVQTFQRKCFRIYLPFLANISSVGYL